VVPFKDVTAAFLGLQAPGHELFQPSQQVDPGKLMPVASIDAPSWHLLDGSKPDGVAVAPLAINSVPGKLAAETGAAYAVERDSGSTRLYMVWISQAAREALGSGRFADVNIHFMFHPPTYEDCYANAKGGYWRGRCDFNGDKDDCVAMGLVGTNPYVKLGARYLATDFRAVLQQLLAVQLRKPMVMYVVPVADSPGNFNDLLDAAKMTRTCQELVIFGAQTSGPSRVTSGDMPFGKVMLSTYSHSGDRLDPLLSQAGNHAFFVDHLSQVNMFDPNVHTNKQQRLAMFRTLCQHLKTWKRTNRNAHMYLYTAYADHVQVFRDEARLVPGTTSVNLDSAPWSEPALKSAKAARPRGVGVEGYTDDGTVGLIHLPIDFFHQWLSDVPANPAGFNHAAHGSGHGHGWFLRTLMAHAVAHADPAWFAPGQRH
jgi:hypothetical protein